MEDQTLELEISLLLPTVDDDQDACLSRLEEALGSRKGIKRAHLMRDMSPVRLCLHFDPSVVSIDDVRQMAKRAGAKISNRFHHLVLPVEGMDCSDCTLVIEHGLKRVNGVLAARVSYALQVVHVEYDSKATSRRAVEKRLGQFGYRVVPEGMRSWYEKNRALLISLLAGLALLAGWGGERFLGTPQWVSLLFYALTYLAGGFDIARHAFGALREKQFNTDLLMLIAALGAASLFEFAEGGLLIFLFSFGHALEDRTLERARAAIRSMAEFSPPTATVRRGDQETEVPVEELAIGEKVIVKPGVRIPVDGEVLTGESAVDQSPITGESMPVPKNRGDLVFAGSINGDGVLDVRVTRLAKDSTLARVVEMVERAQMQKSTTQRAADRFARIFVPAVLILDVALIVGLPLLGVPLKDAFFRAMTVLVAASPCALALGTPAAALAGIAQAARNGVLVKGGGHLENLGRLRAMAFDKTGTLTQGEARVTDLVSFDAWNENEVLAIVAGVESQSEHPLARAVMREALARELVIPEAGQVTSHPGLGIVAEIDGAEVWVGDLRLFEQQGIEVPVKVQAAFEALQAKGRTVMLARRGEVFLGQIGLADSLRQGARQTIEDLRRLGMNKTVMLTGDSINVAAQIADQAGLEEYQAGLMPEEKLNAIQELINEHEVVAMVGDGVNDAPALAKATVGIAMGGARTHVALETADVALMTNDLSKLVFAVGLGIATRRVIHQNLFFAIGVLLILATLALTGLAGMGMAIFLHEGSTILVVLNALRLLGYQP